MVSSTGMISFSFAGFLQVIKPTGAKFIHWNNEFNMCESWVEVYMTAGGVWYDGMQFGRCGNYLEEPINHCIQHYIQEDGSNHN